MGEQTPQQRAEYRDYMFEKYGRPEPFPPHMALAALGYSEAQIKDDEVMAWRYESQEAADAWAAGNLKHSGHPTLGSYPDPAGDGAVIGVTDLRPALAKLPQNQRGGSRTGPLNG